MAETNRYHVTRLIHARDGESASPLESRIGTVARFICPDALVAPTLAGSINGGDVLVHMPFDDAAGWHKVRATFDAALGDPLVDHVDGADYVGGIRGDRPGESTVYRTLLLRVDEGTQDALVERFERETLAMPAYVRAMTSWRLSRVAEAQGNAWTHVWEQTFTDVDGLLGEYMMHPIHWGYVDKWFDPECVEHIISDRVCHSFCAM